MLTEMGSIGQKQTLFGPLMAHGLKATTIRSVEAEELFGGMRLRINEDAWVEHA
jgi:hypothetical protein